jgi:hypothetical protein
VFALASWIKFIMLESKRILKSKLNLGRQDALSAAEKSRNYSYRSPSARAGGAGAVKQFGQGRSCEVHRKFSQRNEQKYSLN